MDTPKSPSRYGHLRAVPPPASPPDTESWLDCAQRQRHPCLELHCALNTPGPLFDEMERLYDQCGWAAHIASDDYPDAESTSPNALLIRFCKLVESLASQPPMKQNPPVRQDQKLLLACMKQSPYAPDYAGLISAVGEAFDAKARGHNLRSIAGRGR